MTKYYYDCPIQALLMIKNHGLKLQCENHEDDDGIEYANGEKYFNFLNIDCTGLETAEDLLEFSTRKIYVHPDSHELLKPQVGDLISVNNSESASLVTHEEFLLQLEAMKHQLVAPCKIIQRQGKAWFTPKEEV